MTRKKTHKVTAWVVLAVSPMYLMYGVADFVICLAIAGFFGLLAKKEW